MLKMQEPRAQNTETSCSNMHQHCPQNAQNVMLKMHKRHAQNAQTSCSKCKRCAQNAETCSKCGNVVLKMRKRAQNAETCSKCGNVLKMRKLYVQETFMLLKMQSVMLKMRKRRAQNAKRSAHVNEYVHADVLRKELGGRAL